MYGGSWRCSGSRSAMNMPSVRNLLMSRSTSTCLCIVVASTIAPATLRFFAQLDERRDHRRVRDVVGAAAQLVEIRRATRRSRSPDRRGTARTAPR